MPLAGPPAPHPDREALNALRIAQRAKLAAKLQEIDGPFYRRISKCGLPFHLACGNCGRSRRVLTRCKWKCCPVCQRAVVAASAARFAKIAKKCVWPLLITLTAAHSSDDGITGLRMIRKAFVKLRAQAWWKRRVSGGVVSWEVSRLSKRERRKRSIGADTGWHFHAHALIDCKWLWITTPPPRGGASEHERNARIKIISDELNAQWSLTLGRTGSIYARRVWKDANGGIDGAVHEVLKYAISGPDLAETEYEIEPLIWALEKARMVQGFGSWYRHPDIKRTNPAPAMCECGCSEWEPEPRDFADRLNDALTAPA